MDIFTEHELLTKVEMRTRLQGINISSLSEEHKEIFNKPLNVEEVKIVAFQIGPLKAPGINGKPSIFYQKYWNILGALTTTSTMSCLNSGHMLKKLNKT